MAKLTISLKARALRYLSMREHSRLELSRKLRRYAQETDDVDSLLDWLEGARFLSQQRFSESLVHRRSARFGNNRIVSELHSHGIAGDELGQAKAVLQHDEVQRARVVLLKKFVEPAHDAAMRAKQFRFLQQRGFSHGAICSAMKACKDFDDSIDTNDPNDIHNRNNVQGKQSSRFSEDSDRDIGADAGQEDSFQAPITADDVDVEVNADSDNGTISDPWDEAWNDDV